MWVLEVKASCRQLEKRSQGWGAGKHGKHWAHGVHLGPHAAGRGVASAREAGRAGSEVPRLGGAKRGVLMGQCLAHHIPVHTGWPE